MRVELQADCYAGIWANDSRDAFSLTDDDIKSALDTAARIGDDALQQAAQGRVVPDSFTHGTSEQRQTWFYRGYRVRRHDQCDTFSGEHLRADAGRREPAHRPQAARRAEARAPRGDRGRGAEPATAPAEAARPRRGGAASAAASMATASRRRTARATA